MNHSTNKATIRGHKTQKNFSSLLRLEFKQVDVAGTGLRPASACALCRNAERGFGTHAGNSSSSSSLRHHNKLIPTSLTSHSRQSYELGARQGRTLAQGAGCWATMRLGLTVTRMLMAGLLGDGDGDVSLRDVSPRDISLYRAFARGAFRLWPLRATSSETERGSSRWLSTGILLIFIDLITILLCSNLVKSYLNTVYSNKHSFIGVPIFPLLLSLYIFALLVHF